MIMKNKHKMTEEFIATGYIYAMMTEIRLLLL